MVPTNINHIKTIKCKGIHRKKTINNTIKNINMAIDKFNSINTVIYDEMSSYASQELQKLIDERIPEYSGMVLKPQTEILYGKNMKSGIIGEIIKQEEKRTESYKKIISNWTMNSDLSPKQIDNDISTTLKKLDSMVKVEKDNIKKICNKYINQGLIEIEKSLNDISNKKLSQLLTRLKKWVDSFRKINENLNQKNESLIKDINTLCMIIQNRRGNLTKENIQSIENLIKSNSRYTGRGWVKGKIKNKAINESDDETNRLLLSLMAIFTDTAGDKTDFIVDYYSSNIKNLIK